MVGATFEHTTSRNMKHENAPGPNGLHQFETLKMTHLNILWIGTRPWMVGLINGDHTVDARTYVARAYYGMLAPGPLTHHTTI